MLPQLEIGGGTPRPRNDKRALDHDGDGDAEQEEGKQRQDDVRQQFAQQDARMRGAERLRRDDEFAPRQRQRRRPRHPHEGGNAEHAENAR